MPDAIKNIDAETILKIHKEEIYLEEDELKDKLKQECNGSRRNERCKIQKQIKEKNLEWKYQYSLLQFSKDQLQESCWHKLKVLRNKCKVLEEKQKQTEEWNDIQIQRKVKEMIPNLTDDRIKQLEEYLENNKRVNEKLMDGNNYLNSKLQEYKEGKSREEYDDLLNRHTDLMMKYSQLEKTKETKNNNNNNDDEIKKLEKRLKKEKQKRKQIEKENSNLKKKNITLEDEIRQLKDNENDSDSDSDSEDNITMEPSVQ